MFLTLLWTPNDDCNHQYDQHALLNIVKNMAKTIRYVGITKLSQEISDFASPNWRAWDRFQGVSHSGQNDTENWEIKATVPGWIPNSVYAIPRRKTTQYVLQSWKDWYLHGRIDTSLVDQPITVSVSKSQYIRFASGFAINFSSGAADDNVDWVGPKACRDGHGNGLVTNLPFCTFFLFSRNYYHFLAVFREHISACWYHFYEEGFGETFWFVFSLWKHITTAHSICTA